MSATPAVRWAELRPDDFRARLNACPVVYLPIGLVEPHGHVAALGLDLKVLMEVFSQTGANSRVLATDGDDMVNRDHACFFSASHAAKDSGIALALSKQAKLDLPLAAAAYKQYKKMTALGLGDLDKSGIAELTFKGRGPKPKKKK
jgi:3-hydroxyisobutyrate dehydrogenase-like beta-hydroxyacid dehydrogenase